MLKLTEKQQKVLEAIKDYTEYNGYPPTVRELADIFNQSSTAGIHNLLTVLQEKGYLRRGQRGSSRSLEVMGGIEERPRRARVYPILGTVPAGDPMLAQELHEGEIELDEEWAGKEDTFILRVHGHSMMDADIQDGDLVIVQKSSTCKNGDIIIALLEEEATVKRFFKEKDRIRLQPENPTMQPIYVSKDDPTFHVIGIVKGLLRKF